jgi:hypothetical protein
MESSGPEVKVRGTASQIYERYLQLARDAASAGDRVLSENYAQHADHYFRLVRVMQPAMPPPQPQTLGDSEIDGDEQAAPAGDAGEEAHAAREEGGAQPDVDFPSGEQQQQQQFSRERDGDRRRRGRRNRYRGDGERGERGEGGEYREAGQAREERDEGHERRAERQDRGDRFERGERREREPREREGEQSGAEGFSSGPKPAFMRD